METEQEVYTEVDTPQIDIRPIDNNILIDDIYGFLDFDFGF